MLEISRAGIEALVYAERGDPSKLIARLRARERLNDDEIEFLVRAVSPPKRGAAVKDMELAARLKTFLWLTRIEGWPPDAARARVREIHRLGKSKSALKVPPKYTQGYHDLMAYHLILSVLQDPHIDKPNEEALRSHLRSEAFPK